MTSEQAVIRKGRRTRAEIEQIVRQFEGSGVNRSQFCREQGLTLGTLNRYLQRQCAGGGASGTALLAVEVAGRDRGAHCSLTVELARGRRIAVAAGFDAATLQRLVQALERM